ALDAELAQHGFGSIEWEFDRAFQSDAEVIEMHGSLDPAEMFSWMGAASNGAIWVSVVLADVDRGVGAPDGVEQRSPEMLSLMVGATVIAAADEPAYRDGTALFQGLERPESTHSD